MAVVGKYDYEPENAARVDLVNALEAAEYRLTAYTMADGGLGGDDGETRTITAKAKLASGAGKDYAPLNGLREDVYAALAEHGYGARSIKVDDKDVDRGLTVVAVRDLSSSAVQTRVPGT
jgi:hypothetical protein